METNFFLANLFILILAFCPEKYPYSTNFGRICCQEKPDRDAFLNEFCRKEQVGTCQAFNVNQKFRCGNHQSVEENCKYVHILIYICIIQERRKIFLPGQQKTYLIQKSEVSPGPGICVKYFLSFPQTNLSPEKIETN